MSGPFCCHLKKTQQERNKDGPATFPPPAGGNGERGTMAGETTRGHQTKWQTPCQQCPLRSLPTFRDFSAKELDFVAQFKRGEPSVERGATEVVGA